MSVLVVDEFGCYVGKQEERIQVRKRGEVLIERPFDDLSSVNIEGRGISLSSDMIHCCARRGIPINCLRFDGQPYAKVMTPMLTATVKTRRHQLQALHDRRSVSIAKAIADGKLANQRSLLLYFRKYRKDAAPAIAQVLARAADTIGDLRGELSNLKGSRIASCRNALMNIEGRAAVEYWSAVWRLVPEDVAPDRRVHQGAQDPVNCMLNYGYGILYSQCWSGVLLSGLDPFGGFIHTDRPGKPSLVLDLQEVFRQPVVDRAVISLLTKGFRVKFEDAGRLEKESRQRLAAEVIERLDTPTRCSAGKITLRQIILQQARRLAVAVRGEKAFKAYIMRW